MTFHYKPEVLEALASHGVRPTPTTRPGFVYTFVSDLYRHELRRLRDRLRAGAFARRDYANHVVALRQRYALVSVHPSAWTLAGTPGESPDRPLC